MQTVSKNTSINGHKVMIHGISTGMVSVKNKFRECTRRGVLAILSFLLDKTFTDWMPIWVWVIEHPEGLFVIDTGENANVNDNNYFKASGRIANFINTTQFKFKVDRTEEVDHQLSQLGLSLDDVSKVYLTHLHLDHIDGLKHFPKKDVYVNKKEMEKPTGHLPKLFPEWFNPIPLEADSSFHEFSKVKSLTSSNDFFMVHTPGHTYGHASYLLKTDEGFILFAGDVVYYQNQLISNKFSAANVNHKHAVNTYHEITAFANTHKLVVLPSHDIAADTRLKYMEPIL